MKNHRIGRRTFLKTAAAATAGVVAGAPAIARAGTAPPLARKRWI